MFGVAIDPIFNGDGEPFAKGHGENKNGHRSQRNHDSSQPDLLRHDQQHHNDKEPGDKGRGRVHKKPRVRFAGANGKRALLAADDQRIQTGEELSFPATRATEFQSVEEY